MKWLRMSPGLRAALPSVVVLVCLLVGWYAASSMYTAGILVELKRGDAVIGADYVSNSHFYLQGYAVGMAACDETGGVHIACERRRDGVSVLSFDPRGVFKRRAVLTRADGRPMLGSLRALAPSPSGARLWIAHEPDEDSPDPANPKYVGVMLALCDASGKAVREYRARVFDVLLLNAVGEDTAYAWEDSGFLRTYDARGDRLAREKLGAYQLISPDGWVWSLDYADGDTKQKRKDRQSGRRSVTISKWKPGSPRVTVCRALLPNVGSEAVPFWSDASGNLYAYIRASRPGHTNLAAHRWIYRVSPSGKVHLLFYTGDLVKGPKDINERVGQPLFVGPDGTVLFETRAYRDVEAGPYRIYKAVPKRRWQVWLEKLGVK